MRGGKWALVAVVAALSIGTATAIFLAAGNFSWQSENIPSLNDTGKQTVRNYVVNVTDSVSIDHK